VVTTPEPIELFGTGLVKTVDDFGAQGEWPSHPELLDWLATEFVNSGWDGKRLLRTIVTSATYRQSSRVGPALYKRDPESGGARAGGRVQGAETRLRAVRPRLPQAGDLRLQLLAGAAAGRARGARHPTVSPQLGPARADEFSYNVTRDPVHVHDLHATLLHCLGIDHKRLTFKFQGRHHRLTDVHGNVVKGILA
jgi:hypothetical protein